MKSPVWTIYCHIHIASDRKYIGQTQKTMLQRWNQHCSQAKNSIIKKDRWHFPNAIHKYGKDAFKHEVLRVCNSLEEANAAEIEYIEKYDTTNPEKGFNLSKGGAHTPHPVNGDYRNNPEFHKKASARSKKMWQDPNYKSKVLTAVQNALNSPEVIEKMNTPEYKQRMSEIGKQVWQDPEYLARQKEIWSDPELIEKARSRWDDPEFRAKCSSGPLKHIETVLARTHCDNGHEFTLENTYISTRGGRSNGSRACKTCRNIKAKHVRTHCTKGHEYTLENTRQDNRGKRLCVTCLGLGGKHAQSYKDKKNKHHERRRAILSVVKFMSSLINSSSALEIRWYI